MKKSSFTFTMDIFYAVMSMMPGLVIFYKFGLDKDLIAILYVNTVITLGFISYVIWRRKRYFALKSDAQTVTAKVLQGSDNKNFFLKYKVEKDEIEVYRVRELFENKKFNYAEGDKIEVLVNPKNPNWPIIPDIAPF